MIIGACNYLIITMRVYLLLNSYVTRRRRDIKIRSAPVWKVLWVYLWQLETRLFASCDTLLVPPCGFGRYPSNQYFRHIEARPQTCTRVSDFSYTGNNTFETSDFADIRFSFWGREGAPLSPTVCYGVKSSLTKEFVFSYLLTGEKSKSK